MGSNGNGFLSLAMLLILVGLYYATRSQKSCDWLGTMTLRFFIIILPLAAIIGACDLVRHTAL